MNALWWIGPTIITAASFGWAQFGPVESGQFENGRRIFDCWVAGAVSVIAWLLGIACHLL
jgi:hypothetical protein